mmetsp:Transcript_5447/g.10379  ORF Transcript_5447/g.10379 Transcript_5447/m.10379 type:complete len:429 (+) Transcript_5447:180-1466(+)
MISMLYLMNAKGDVIIQRQYRDDVSSSATDVFRAKVIAAKEASTSPPVRLLDSSTFVFTRHLNIYFVAVTRSNVNPSLVLEYLYQKVRVLQAYLGDSFTEDKVRNNFTLLYELFDETVDFGYPQNTSVDVLKMYINLGKQRQKVAQDQGSLTSQITGAIDWRREGIRHKRNEVYIDVLESVNLLLSSTGSILRQEVTGSVMMNTKLTGMPECKFGLNDKLVVDKDKSSAHSGKSGVAIDDCTFHRCVSLGRFDADRTITFIPPDGEFELMRYRVTDNINLPFRIIAAIQEDGQTRVTINVKCTATFSEKLFASSVTLKIPVPGNTAKCRIKCTMGRAKYVPEESAIVFRLKRFQGQSECMLAADVQLMPTVRAKAWSRPPLALDFSVPMFTASGVHVRFLKVFDKSGYTTNRWVRYITKSGASYCIRI